MNQDRHNQKPSQGQNVENNQILQNNDASGRFESDSKKVVRRHLEDEDHVITDEEMQNIRVGMEPAILDEATQARFGDEENLENTEEEILGEDVDDIKEDENSDGPITPWDTIQGK